MGNRGSLIMTVLTVVAVTGYNLRGFEGTTDVAVHPTETPPAVEAAPSLGLQKPLHSAIASLDVWDFKPLTLPGQMPSLKEMFKPFYTLNKNGRFESIQRSDRPNDQWQFQGVVARGDTLRVLFYNAGLKRLKNLGHGDAVDEKLVIRSISPASVTLETLGEKKPQKFELRIFNANKDQYVAKRKNP